MIGWQFCFVLLLSAFAAYLIPDLGIVLAILFPVMFLLFVFYLE